MVGFYGSRKQHVSCRLPHLERRLVLDTQLLTFGSAMEDPRYPRKLQLTDDLINVSKNDVKVGVFLGYRSCNSSIAEPKVSG